MAIEVVDLLGMAHRDGQRKVVFNTPRMHAWVHVYPKPGDKDDLHCHNADQTFYVIEGQCTMHFPDGSASVLNPGMAAVINGGSFYQLENTGDGPMIMMGNRSGPSENIKHINYDLKRDLNELSEDEIAKVGGMFGGRSATQ